MQVGRSRSLDSKWSKINDRPRINEWPAWLWSACSWRTVSEGKRIQRMIYGNAVLKNNEQQLNRWSSKCRSPPHCNILILSSAVSISHRFHFVWTGTIRRLWWSPGSVCFCNHVKRQSLTHMCDSVPSSEEPFGAIHVFQTCPKKYRAWSSLPFCTVIYHRFWHYYHFCHPSTHGKQKPCHRTYGRLRQSPKPKHVKAP